MESQSGQQILKLGEEHERTAIEAENTLSAHKEKAASRLRWEPSFYRGKAVRMPNGEQGTFLEWGAGGMTNAIAAVCLNGAGGRIKVTRKSLESANQATDMLW